MKAGFLRGCILQESACHAARSQSSGRATVSATQPTSHNQVWPFVRIPNVLWNLRRPSWEQAAKPFLVFKQWHIVFFLKEEEGGEKKSNHPQGTDTI